MLFLFVNDYVAIVSMILGFVFFLVVILPLLVSNNCFTPSWRAMITICQNGVVGLYILYCVCYVAKGLHCVSLLFFQFRPFSLSYFFLVIFYFFQHTIVPMNVILADTMKSTVDLSLNFHRN